MIPLLLRGEVSGRRDELVCRARLEPVTDQDARLEQRDDRIIIGTSTWQVAIQGVSASDLDGDVLLVQPQRGVVQRLIRGASKHNTLLITERCDQLCVMCSQPPKKSHDDLFRHYKTACMLAPRDAVIGLSGGEPTLYKDELFDLLDFVLTMRPDLRFHVLTNAQHFVEDDVGFLASLNAQRILWGVPLYAPHADVHDQIVGKADAHNRLLDGLAVLCRAGAPMELRTVVMKQNAPLLPELARFIVRHVPFARPWAIMQLENIGYARNRWNELFYDHSIDFNPIRDAVETARLHGVEVMLYNFPLCTVPTSYRRLAPSTISDWKRRFEPVCDGCVAKRWCSGFFEWHPSQASYQRMAPL